MKIDGKTMLITGASAGIGWELALLSAPRIKKLILTARRKERLEDLKSKIEQLNPSAEVELFPLDLTDRPKVDQMIQKILEGGGVDILVNNAGFGDMSLFDMARWERLEGMIDLNIKSLVYLTYKLLPPMLERKSGVILNVSSAYGLTFGPGFAVYIGTKHFVTGFTEALRVDLTGTGVTAVQVCPGPVKTEFQEVMGNFIDRPIPNFIMLPARKCAQHCLKAIEKEKPLLISANFFGKIMVYMGLLTPRWLLRLVYRPFAKMMRRAQQKYLSEKNRSE